ncbi:MAG: efflux RND transporter periplasmic adaptor subunit [Bacteroidota bacterium]
MTLKKILIILGLVLLLLLILVPRFLKQGIKNESGSKPLAPIVLVKAIVMRPQNLLNEILANGTILANQQVELHPEVNGRLVSLTFKEGQNVRKGDLLAKLFDGDLQAQRNKLNVQLELAQKNEKRQKELLQVNGISQQDYDATLTQLNGVKADIELITAQISKTEVHAPFNGKIGLRNVDEGAYVSPSIMVASLQEIDPVRIDFSVPEKYMSLIHVDDEIIFNIAGLNEDFAGRVFAIEPRIDPITRTLQIRARCPNSFGKIYPGAFAKVRLALKDINNSLLAPTQAVIPESRGQKVFVIRSGKAQPQKVVTGIRNEKTIEIVEGLNPGDTLISDGIIQLKPGIQVKITELR